MEDFSWKLSREERGRRIVFFYRRAMNLFIAPDFHGGLFCSFNLQCLPQWLGRKNSGVERLRNLTLRNDPLSHQKLTYCTYLITISHYIRNELVKKYYLDSQCIVEKKKKKERAWARALLILTRSTKDGSYARGVIWNPCRKHNNLANRKSLQHLKSCLFATMYYWNVYIPYIELASFFEKSLCYENRGNIRTPRRRKLFVPIFNEITLEEKRPQKSFSHSKTSLKNYCFTELN